MQRLLICCAFKANDAPSNGGQSEHLAIGQLLHLLHLDAETPHLLRFQSQCCPLRGGQSEHLAVCEFLCL